MAKREIAFNGRFLTARRSGVQRVAEELIRRTDILLGESANSPWRWEVLSPRTTTRKLNLLNIIERRRGNLSGQLWEQFELPWLSRNKLLVNLCNLSPLITKGGITLIHDAQILISPRSYSWLFKAWYRFVLPHIGSNAARIITVSNYSREKLIEFGIAPANKIEVVYNGVDHKSLSEADPDYLMRLALPPHSYALAFSSTQKHKNISVLFEAMATPEAMNLRLVLVGAENRRSFEQKGHIVPDNILFVGRASDAELRALYEGAICLLFPSTTEGFGLPPLEAMLAGCPAIVAPCGALPEVCGEAVVYVKPHDAKAWSKAILELQTNDTARSKLISDGYKRAAQFTWDKSAIRLIEIIAEVAAQKFRTS